MLIPVSDLCLSGYEFHDSVGWNNPQDNDRRDLPDTLGESILEAAPEGLVTDDPVIGNGPPVEKTTIASYYYIIMKLDNTCILRNDQGSSPPVCSTPT